MDVGDRIGNYRLEREVLHGSSTVVFLAKHLVLPRRAVIKLMPDATQPAAVGMLREACILDALSHPGIVRVFESGIHAGGPWFAIEHIEGPSLRTVMSPGAVDRVDAIALLRDLADLIEHAYHRGIVHTGIRPELILLTGRRRSFPLCIADWGAARVHDSRLQQYFPDQAAWHYTSPELVAGDPIDDRTDVFSIGVIAYQLLTGKLPFDQGILAVVDDGTTQHVPTIVHCPDIPPELASLVDAMLAYDRWDRPSAAEVLAELSWIADALATPIHSRPPAAGQLRMRRPRWTPALEFGERARTNTLSNVLSQIADED
jgi:serine/threonine-protein kinase